MPVDETSKIPTTEPLSISEDIIAQEVRGLMDRWHHDFLVGPGWFHIVTQHDRGNKDVGTFPDGQPIPLDYIMDNWYQVNAKKEVVAGVFIMSDFSGTEVQKSVYREGKLSNLTFDIESEAAPLPLNLDFGFTYQASRAVSRDEEQLFRVQTVVENEDVLKFTLKNEYESAISMTGFDQLVSGTERSIYYDPIDNQMVKIERALLTERDEFYIIEMTSFLTLEQVTVLPVHIQDILK